VSIATRLPEPRRLTPTEWIAGASVVAATVLVTASATNSTAGRALVAVAFTGFSAFVVLRSPREAIFVVLAWLAVLGITRRLASEVLADPAKDPLLLVAPIASGLLCARALLEGAWRSRGWLANGVAAFSVVMVIAVLNPEQDTLLVGIAGLLVWLAPTLWFWIGRQYVDGHLAAKIVNTAGVASVLASIYGLAQIVIGFPPWDDRWIDQRGDLTALYIGPDTVRPFGVSTSASEFSLVTAFACLWAVLVALRALRRGAGAVALVAAAAATLSGLALLLSAVRTTLVSFLAAVLVLYLVRRRGRWWIPVVAGIAGLGLVFAAAQLVDVDSIPDTGASASVRRMVAFVQDPFGERYEVTTDSHLRLAGEGVEGGIRRPLGWGTGSTNRGAEQFGDAGASRNREFDLANAGEAFGVLGMLLVVVITVAAFAVAIRRSRRRPDLVHLSALGLLVISIGHWWNGGHYFTAALLWLLLGWLDAPTPAGTRSPPPVAVTERA
jgi:hypothetical protein